MNGLLLLIIACCIYYCIYKWYPDYLEEKYHYYFGGFVTIYSIILYLFTFENEFMYKFFRNIYETSKQPLYSFNAHNSNSELYNSLNSNHDLKPMLAQKQLGRCAQCKNFIIEKDIPHYKLKYLYPLQFGGKNDLSNIGLVCPHCMF